MSSALIVNTASGASEVSTSSYLKEKSFVAARTGKDVVAQWTKNSNDVSYRLIIGQLATTKEPLGSKVLSKYTERIDLINNLGKIVYSVYFNPSTERKNLSARDKWIYSEKITDVRDEDSVALLITNTSSTQTYSMSFFLNREGGFMQQGLNVLCSISTWGEPISKGVLSATNLSLTALSYLPGVSGSAATVGSRVVNYVSMAANTTIMGSEEVVRSEINYQIDTSKADPKKIKIGETIKVKLANGQTRTATIKSISGAGKATNLVLDVYVSIQEAKSLFETIKTARSSASETKELCRQMN